MAAKLKAEHIEAFADEYIIDFNGTRAAVACGYSEKTAAQQASRLLRNVKVSEAIRRKVDERAKRTKTKADKVLREIERLAMSDLRKLFDEDGNLKHPKDWPTDIARAVSGVDVEYIYARGEGRVGETRKVKLWSKPGALAQLAQHLGIGPKEDDDGGEKAPEVHIYLPDNGRDKKQD